MPSGKKRLYIALFPSGVPRNEERKCHIAFLIGPKNEAKGAPGVQYHAKNSPLTGWIYEELEHEDIAKNFKILVRILIAKVEDEQRLVSIFRSVAVVQNDPNWHCRTWIANALAGIAKDGKAVGTAELDWAKIESVGREYVARKAAEGVYKDSARIHQAKPTWDMLENREIIS